MYNSCNRLMNKPPRRPLFLLLSVWLLASLACNLPVRIIPRPVATLEARQTLTARLLPTSTGTFVVPVDTAAPVVGFTPAVGLTAEAAISPVPQTPLQPPVVLVPDNGEVSYTLQSGDTLPSLAARFAVSPDEIRAAASLPAAGLLPAGGTVVIPTRVYGTGPGDLLLPDGSVVNGPGAAGFDIEAYIKQAGGYLSRYQQQIGTENLTGVEIIRRVSTDTSLNPKLLLALLEYRSGWVFGSPADETAVKHPIGFNYDTSIGLFPEMILTARTLTVGYYGWRSGAELGLEFTDGRELRKAPGLNAGSAALQHLFAAISSRANWEAALYGELSFPAFYARMFGDPWNGPDGAPIFPTGLQQPAVELPFLPGKSWSVTAGPHTAWGTGSPYGALDFAPIGEAVGCHISPAWATAAAAGVVARSERGVAVIDLDGDGREQTGWTLLYLHVSDYERTAAGTTVALDARIGHPSCEGGKATGTHVHLVRRLNGEWLPVSEAFPFTLSGWQVVPGANIYQGTLLRGDQVVTARTDGSRPSLIQR